MPVEYPRQDLRLRIILGILGKFMMETPGGPAGAACLGASIMNVKLVVPRISNLDGPVSRGYSKVVALY